MIKVWDILAPYFVSDLEPTWSSAIQVRGPWTATGWAFLEIAVVSVVSLLRVPMLSPSLKQVGQLAGVIVVWNVVCCFFADVSDSESMFASRSLMHYSLEPSS